MTIAPDPSSHSEPLGAGESPLGGGNITAGVVRVGDTVRRPRQPSSTFVELLLSELAAAGFSGTPRHLGVDEQGRDVFSFIEGDSEPNWHHFEGAQVIAGASLLRSFHDATRLLDLRGAEEVVCHGDAGPHNFIFRDGLPVALIDFAAPGPALRSLLCGLGLVHLIDADFERGAGPAVALVGRCLWA